MMNTRAIDYVIEDFYESLSFQDGEQPDLETVQSLFYGEGILINNSLAEPKTYTAETFVKSIEAQVATEELTQFMQRELYSKTDLFGKIAQRVSVYEYSLNEVNIDNPTKGINYIQFVWVDDIWRITAMAWSDENENYQIPEELVD